MYLFRNFTIFFHSISKINRRQNSYFLSEPIRNYCCHRIASQLMTVWYSRYRSNTKHKFASVIKR